MFVSEQERGSAIGEFKCKDQEVFYENMTEIFQPLEMPKPGDWLFGSKEAHQAYTNYRLPFYNPVTPERSTIYIQQFDIFDQAFIKQLCKFCQLFYSSLKVKCLPPVKFQKQLGGIRKREGYYRNQYRAQDILEYMEKRVPGDAYCVMGITLQDIYPADSWLFAYGWAKYKARVGIFSFLRFDELFARKKTDKIDWNIILYPSMRTMAHQIGHMFGVTHCVYYRCLMNGFNGIQQNYSKPFQFCPICYRKISTNIKFDLVERYKGLLYYFKGSKIQLMKGDIDIYEKLLMISEKYPFKIEQLVQLKIKPTEQHIKLLKEKELLKPIAKKLPQSVKKPQTKVAKVSNNTFTKAKTMFEKPKIAETSTKKTTFLTSTNNRATSLMGKLKK